MPSRRFPSLRRRRIRIEIMERRPRRVESTITPGDSEIASAVSLDSYVEPLSLISSFLV